MKMRDLGQITQTRFGRDILRPMTLKKFNGSIRRTQKPEHHLQGCAFARAVRPQKPKHFTLLDGQVQILYRLDNGSVPEVFKDLSQILNLNDVVHSLILNPGWQKRGILP